MIGLAALISISVIFWFTVTQLSNQDTRVLGMIFAPILSGTTFFSFGYIADGYWEPFMLITAVGSLIVSATVILFLEAIRRQAAHYSLGLTIKSKRTLFICGSLLCSISLYPFIDNSIDRYNQRIQTDAYMLDKASIKARQIVKEKLNIAEHYQLNINYERNAAYTCEVVLGDEILAQFTLHTVTLELITFQSTSKITPPVL